MASSRSYAAKISSYVKKARQPYGLWPCWPHPTQTQAARWWWLGQLNLILPHQLWSGAQTFSTSATPRLEMIPCSLMGANFKPSSGYTGCTSQTLHLLQLTVSIIKHCPIRDVLHSTSSSYNKAVIVIFIYPKTLQEPRNQNIPTTNGRGILKYPLHWLL